MQPDELNIDWINDDKFIIVELKINGIWYNGTLDSSEGE